MLGNIIETNDFCVLVLGFALLHLSKICKASNITLLQCLWLYFAKVW